MSEFDARHARQSSSDLGIENPDRLAALDETGLLDIEPQAHFDRLTQLVAQLLKCKVALISLVDTDRQFFLSQCGLGEPYASNRETPLSHSFCQYVVTSRAPLIIVDARTDPLVATNGAVVDLGVTAYLGFPIMTRDGQVLGSLCAIETEPRQWTSDDLDLVAKFARIAEDEIALGDRAVAASVRANASAILAREYHHRVKNSLAVSSALVRISAKDAFSIDEVVATASARLSALANAHDLLMSKSDAVDLKELAARLLLPYCSPGSRADVEGPTVLLKHSQVTPLCLFLHELATNSAKYGAFENHGSVSVRWTEDNRKNVDLRWTEELTNSLDQDRTTGFGTTLLKIAAGQLDGRYTSRWVDDRLLVRLTFPT